ncbi:hypothetical protein CMV_028615 [Castanea mollissima]|uniref:Uncharacterized protein n=1 Tax=Castanea mollissima TaxID=60419 RepID=A0A8J4V880_9ROSI|nr:hypothetical protein CMV_028615 [Castanea mollissima]
MLNLKNVMENMEGHKIGIMVLLFCGTILLGVDPTNAVKACPDICLAYAYMTCPSSGNQKLDPACNCCFAPGCTLYLPDGTSTYCN